MSDIKNLLTEPFPQEVERQLKKGGATLTYIPVSEVITRLNNVFGVTGWSYEIINVSRDNLDPDFVVAWVRLTVNRVDSDGAVVAEVSRDGVGGQKIKYTKGGDIVDLGDEMKGAVSDALKKAAQHFGIGLYLARSEEAMYLEYVDETAEQPISEEHFDRLRVILNALSVAHIEMCHTYWAELSDGSEFLRDNVTRPRLESMLQFVKSLSSDDSA